MFAHQSRLSLSLLVMCVVIMQAHSDICSDTFADSPPENLSCNICITKKVRKTVIQANRYVEENLSSQQAWSQIGTQLSRSQKDGICNLLALRDVAERAQGIGTAAGISSSLELLEQNMEDACKVVFADSIPDRDCKDVLRYNCFLSNNGIHEICSNSS